MSEFKTKTVNCRIVKLYKLIFMVPLTSLDFVMIATIRKCFSGLVKSICLKKKILDYLNITHGTQLTSSRYISNQLSVDNIITKNIYPGRPNSNDSENKGMRIIHHCIYKSIYYQWLSSIFYQVVVSLTQISHFHSQFC